MSRPGAGTRRNLLSISDLGPDVAGGIDEVMTLTDSFVEVSERQIPKVPALRGRTVVSLFFEVRIPPTLEHRARWLRANSSFSDAELEYLATGRLEESDSDAENDEE